MRLHDLPASWKWVSLEDVAAKKKHAICDGPFGSNMKTSDYVDSGIPVLQGKNITNNIFKMFDIRYITQQKAIELKRSKVIVGDVLLVKIGSIGYAAIIDSLNGFEAAIIPANMAKISPNEKVVDTKYLYRWLISQSVSDYLKRIASKTAQPALSLSKIKGVPFPLPPLSEQKRIAAILDKADEIRKKRKKSIELTETFLRSVFLEMFGDPVTNPKGWEVVVLGDVIHSAKDGPHVSPTYSDGGIPFLSTRHIKPNGVIWEDLKYISLDEAKRQWKKCKPERGDILYTKGGTTGIATHINFDDEIAVWVHVALLKTDHELVSPVWLSNMLNTQYCYTQSQKYTHGITNKDLGLKRMVKIEMYLPPLSEQKKFERLYLNTHRTIGMHYKASQESGNLFNSLVQRAFRGEL